MKQAKREAITQQLKTIINGDFIMTNKALKEADPRIGEIQNKVIDWVINNKMNPLQDRTKIIEFMQSLKVGD